MQMITPTLWFDNEAEEAARFYTSVFSANGGNSKILEVTPYPEAAEEVSGKPKGSVMTVLFELQGQRFIALNGGPEFKFTEAISFMVPCEDQEEIDYFWEKLTAGGEEGPCGWLKDRYGLSWQVVPKQLEEMLRDKDSRKVERVTAAFLKIKKFDLEELRRAQNLQETGAR